MAGRSKNPYEKYGVLSYRAYDFKAAGNERAGDYGRVEKTQRQIRKKGGKSASPAVSVAAIICAIFLLAGIMSQTSLVAISDESYALQQEINELEEKQRELKIQHAMAFPLSDTEKYAIDVLGMQKAVSEQIRYIELSEEEPSSSEEIKNNRFRDFLSRLQEYFPG